ncbi:MAG: thiamine diphosphokinase [Clostridium sp.]|nr:thiamine diphosphokinase [Clostridium sp.]
MGTKIKTCVIVGASPTTDSTFIRPILKQADYIICADGGWNYVHLTGVCPHLIVGDFDSACDIIPKETESISLPTHKDDTDLLVAVKEGLKRGYTDFVILGALGGRLDHTYGNLCVLQYILQHGGTAVLQNEDTQVYLLEANHDIELTNVQGNIVSVFPFGCDSCTLTYDGLEYPLKKGTLVSCAPVGVSNVAESHTAHITCHSGTAVIMVLTSKEE